MPPNPTAVAKLCSWNDLTTLAQATTLEIQQAKMSKFFLIRF